MIPKTKHTLRFNNDGKFKILMVSDIQDKLEYDERTLKGLYAMIDAEKPDLMIWGGDNCDGRYLKTREELTQYLEIFTRPMEERALPWMHVYGNHDYDIDVDAKEQSEMYEAYPYCISGHTEGIPGVTNYAVPILDSETDEIKYCIYAFDSKHKSRKYKNGTTHEDLLLPNRDKSFRKWETVGFEQQMWYWKLSCEIEAKEGRTVPAMAVMHVPPHEIMMTVNNPEETGYTGYADEKMQCAVLNSGIFSTMMERGDVNVITAGHLHRDTVDGVFGGIRLCLDACAGFAPSGIDERRGGRVFEISDDGKVETRMIFLKDLMDIS